MVGSSYYYNSINGKSNCLYSRFCCGSIHLFIILKKFLNKELRINLSLFFGTSYFLLFASSLFLEILDNIKKFQSFSETDLAEFTRRKEVDIPEREKAKKLNYKFLMYPDFIANNQKTFRIFNKNKFYPLATQPNTKTYYCNEGYGLIKYNSDRFGFRNEDNNWDRDIDTFLIGDSFIHGACVNNKYTISSKLSNLTRRNIINLGTSRNGIDDYYALLKFQSEIRQRKRVKGKTIVFFYANDLNSSKKLSSRLAREFIPENIFLNKNTLGLNKKYQDAYEKSRKELGNIIAKNDRNIRYYLINSSKFSSLRRRIRQLNNTERKNKKLSCEFKLDNTIYDLAKHIANLEKENKGTYLVAYIPSSSYWRPSCTQKNINYICSLYLKREISLF